MSLLKNIRANLLPASHPRIGDFVFTFHGNRVYPSRIAHPSEAPAKLQVTKAVENGQLFIVLYYPKLEAEIVKPEKLFLFHENIDSVLKIFGNRKEIQSGIELALIDQQKNSSPTNACQPSSLLHTIAIPRHFFHLSAPLKGKHAVAAKKPRCVRILDNTRIIFPASLCPDMLKRQHLSSEELGSVGETPPPLPSERLPLFPEKTDKNVSPAQSLVSPSTNLVTPSETEPSEADTDFGNCSVLPPVALQPKQKNAQSSLAAHPFKNPTYKRKRGRLWRNVKALLSQENCHTLPPSIPTCA